MEISFELYFEDLMDVQKDVVANSRHQKKTRLILLIISLFPLCIFLVISKFSFFSLLVTILWSIFFPSLFNYLTLKGMKRILKNQNNTSWIGRHRLTIDDVGIIKETEITTSTYKWGQFVRKSEDRNKIYLYISDTQTAVVIPKGAIIDKEFKDMLEQYFEKYIARNKT